jgi:hypothetical protein
MINPNDKNIKNLLENDLKKDPNDAYAKFSMLVIKAIDMLNEDLKRQENGNKLLTLKERQDYLEKV